MWLNIIIYGSILAMLVFLIQRKSLNPIVKTIMGVLILALFVFVLDITTGSIVFLGSEKKLSEVSPYREIIFFLFMAFGMMARYISRAIEDRRQKIIKLKKTSKVEYKKPRLEFDAWEFSYPFFISVITFGALINQIDDEAIKLSNLILSFQTGFFWQTILNREGQEYSE